MGAIKRLLHASWRLVVGPRLARAKERNDEAAHRLDKEVRKVLKK